MFHDPNVYEILVSDARLVVDFDIWRSWTGHRYMNGKEFHHGDVYAYGTNTVSVNSRVCGCSVCQSTVPAEHRPN